MIYFGIFLAGVAFRPVYALVRDSVRAFTHGYLVGRDGTNEQRAEFQREHDKERRR